MRDNADAVTEVNVRTEAAAILRIWYIFAACVWSTTKNGRLLLSVEGMMWVV